MKRTKCSCDWCKEEIEEDTYEHYTIKINQLSNNEDHLCLKCAKRVSKFRRQVKKEAKQ